MGQDQALRAVCVWDSCRFDTIVSVIYVNTMFTNNVWTVCRFSLYTHSYVIIKLKCYFIY